MFLSDVWGEVLFFLSDFLWSIGCSWGEWLEVLY